MMNLKILTISVFHIIYLILSLFNFLIIGGFNNLVTKFLNILQGVLWASTSQL